MAIDNKGFLYSDLVNLRQEIDQATEEEKQTLELFILKYKVDKELLIRDFYAGLFARELLTTLWLNKK